MKTALALLNAAVLALALTACGGRGETSTPRLQDTPPPSIQVSSTQTDNVETLQMTMKMETHLEHFDLTLTPPESLAYQLYKNGELAKTRVDIPGNSYSDNVPRVFLYDVESDVGYVYKKSGSTYTLDPEITSEVIAQLGLGEQIQDANAHIEPLTTMSEEEFKLQAQTLGYNVQGAEGQLTAQTSDQSSEDSEEITLYYDSEVGAVTKYEQVSTIDGQTQVLEGTVKFTEVPGMNDIILPYETKIVRPTDGTLSSQSTGADTLEISPSQTDKVIPSGWSATSYEPTLTTASTDTVEQTIRFDDIKVNLVDPNIFSIGGQ